MASLCNQYNIWNFTSEAMRFDLWCDDKPQTPLPKQTGII